MKKVNVRKLFMLIVVMLLVLSAVSVSATDSEGFSDVPENHWAKESIELMADLGIIEGYGNNTFGPEDVVTREQFSKMMVLTLDLTLIEPLTPFFEDVAKEDWSYKYVETARYYLTGFRAANGDYFRPEQKAVREDMAVAIVKGLGLSVIDVDLSVLNRFSDKSVISKNLKPYVAKAVETGIMVGDEDIFNANGTLTRAEAATLLARLVVEEKVVYEEDTKVTYEEEDPVILTGNRTSELKLSLMGDEVKLDWTQTDSTHFKYYKLVFSEKDASPEYPEDGYLTYISDVKDTDYYVESGQSYNGGDVDGKLRSGTTYYVSITAVYEDGESYYPSNALSVIMP